MFVVPQHRGAEVGVEVERLSVRFIVFINFAHEIGVPVHFGPMDPGFLAIDKFSKGPKVFVVSKFSVKTVSHSVLKLTFQI